MHVPRRVSPFSHLARAACRRSRWRPRQKSCTRATSTASAPSRTSIRLPRPPSPAVRRALAAGFIYVGGGGLPSAAGKRGRCSRTIEVRRFGDGMRERRAKWLDWIKQKVRAMQRAARNPQHATCNQAACAPCQMQHATGSMPHHEMKRRALQCNIGASLQHSAPRATCNRAAGPAVRPLRIPVGLGSVCVGAAHGTVSAARHCRGRPRPCQVFDAASSPGAIQRALDAADCDVLSSLAETAAADGAADGDE